MIGVSFCAAQILGSSTTHKGQLSVLCTAFDYGASHVPATNRTIAGLTPRLSPFPPPPIPCSAYNTEATCPNRCYWSEAAGCANTPPIPCGSNVPGGGGNNALCVHVIVNTTAQHNWSYLADQGSYNETVIYPPKKSFDRELWYSTWDGEVLNPPSIHKFRYCIQYGTGVNSATQFAVCISLDGTFDLQVATTNTLTYHAEWQSNAPFVAKVVIYDSTTQPATAVLPE